MYTFQALSEEDLELWLDAMDGKEPVYERPLRPSDASQTFLDEAGFNFIQRCIQVLEYRGESRFVDTAEVCYSDTLRNSQKVSL